MLENDSATTAWSGPEIPNLPDELTLLLRQVPRGGVTTFGDLAVALGDIAAARWVATQLAEWRRAGISVEDIPWHRVVQKNGALAVASLCDPAEQRECLSAEGLAFTDSERVFVSDCYRAFRTQYPLRPLAGWQRNQAQQVQPGRTIPVPSIVAAIDVSYVDSRSAVAAYVSYDVRQRQILETVTAQLPVKFPYIPGYLTFREVPAMLAVLQMVSKTAEPASVLLVDGSGIMHPRRFGVAVCLGQLSVCVTIGVAKHRLFGQDSHTDAPDVPIRSGQELLGYKLLHARWQQPLYVSPGTGIDADSARTIVRAVWDAHRLPEPQFWADANSRRVARRIRTTRTKDEVENLAKGAES